MKGKDKLGSSWRGRIGQENVGFFRMGEALLCLTFSRLAVIFCNNTYCIQSCRQLAGDIHIFVSTHTCRIKQSKYLNETQLMLIIYRILMVLRVTQRSIFHSYFSIQGYALPLISSTVLPKENILRINSFNSSVIQEN